MDWLTNPEIWAALLTLTALEIVLGVRVRGGLLR
jgi:predicted tellurium resistance membrane protein TerC